MFAPTPTGASRERNPLHTPLSLGGLPAEVSQYLQGDMPVPTPRWLFGPRKPAWRFALEQRSSTSQPHAHLGYWDPRLLEKGGGEISPTFTCPRA